MSRAVVIGGGFFGCVIAAELTRSHRQVVLLERESQIMSRASANNQARIHQGYHYPRSVMTFKRSQENFNLFVDEYRDCVVDGFEKIYAIAKHGSLVTAGQFELVCERLKAPISKASKQVSELFNSDLIDAVFKVQEFAFNALKLREMIAERLRLASVDVRLGVDVQSVASSKSTTNVTFAENGRASTIAADHVFNCTYAGLNDILDGSGQERLALKFQLAEMPLVQVPPKLAGLGITVMDGPFFSLMPFPSTPHHSMSHVRYTHHAAWTSEQMCPLQAKPKSNFEIMRRDIARYLPLAGDSKQYDSIWEIKTILPQSSLNDSRPILFKKHDSTSGFYSVLGAKIDNVSDVLSKVREVCLLNH